MKGERERRGIRTETDKEEKRDAERERMMRTKIRADERWSEMYNERSETEKACEREGGGVKCLKASITLPRSVMQRHKREIRVY